ncbi:inner nuclear membrane protein enriched at telomere/subtelomere region [Coemansia sp. RSA 988]|nr:inner nuclear membrane protein enriched at telomere/subtelomere region [Coemansia sp. RSA 988]
MNSEQYLEAGFDSQTLKMSTIRNILVKHNVEYPSNAKKGELLDILQTSVLDRATKLRKEAKKQKRVKGDGRDIEQMAGTSANNQPGVSTIGLRTRSQTPRTERVRPPMFSTTKQNEEKKSAPIKEEERVVLPKKKKKSVADAPAGAVEKKDKKKLKKSKDKSDIPAKPAKSATTGLKEDRKGISQQQSEPTTPPRATMGNAAEAKRTAGAKRKLSDAEQDTSVDSDDERFFTPAKTVVGDAQRQRIARRRAIKQQRKDDVARGSDSEAQTPRRKKETVVAGHRGAKSQGPVNFSDENPFQSSPETARKRRRRVEATSEGGGPATPMSALRKSQTSGLTFKVALPRTSREEEPSTAEDLHQESGLEASDSAMMEEDTPEPLEMSEPLAMPEQRQTVSDLVAKYQKQAPTGAMSPRSPTVRIRDGLKRQQQQQQHTAVASDTEPLKAEEKPVVDANQNEVAAPRRTEEATRARFTMTPDALRQMAARGARGAADHAPPAHEPRRKTMAAAVLPPIAPGIPAARSDKQPFHYAAQPHERIVATQQAPIDQAEAQELQRRRVATLRQHVESARADDARRTHSRRSSVASIASSVGEERGIPAIPAGSPATAPHGRSAKGTPWTARVLWAAAAGAVALVWHAHAQFAVGFGSARSDYAPLAPPADSALAFPEPPAASDAPLAERVKYYALYARAAFLAPAPLDCPAHADCVPYAPIPPAYATPAAVADPAVRDQWLVPVVDRAAPAGTRNEQRVAVVQCDTGHVLQFPPLASWLLPRVPACVRDVSTELRVAQLVDAMSDECGAVRGRAQCEQTLMQQARDLLVRGELGRLTQAGEGDSVESEDEAEEIERLGLSTADLRTAMWRRKSPRLTDAEFDELFRRAVEQLAEKEELVSNFVIAYEGEDESGETTYFVSRHPQYPPLCYVRRLLLSAVLGNLTGVLAMVAVGVAAYVAARRYAAHRAEVVAADALVGSALQRLKRQARRHYLDPALSPSPAIPSLQLRDLLLLASSTPTPASPMGSPLMTPTSDHTSSSVAAVAYFDPRARNSVWERVRSVVERNANVRCRTTAVRGEPMRVWEWIGPLEDDDADVLFSPLGSPQ